MRCGANCIVATLRGGALANELEIPESHRKKCFVAAPFGRGMEEQRAFKGWYQHVIKPAIEQVGFEPYLSAAQDAPAAINDEIRKHLAFDPMCIVDLAGGIDPLDPPNPNVMYELGIRHAFGLPVVTMALEGQQLPFDVANQRTIMSRRDVLATSDAKANLAKSLDAAKTGAFYNPMKAVGREARLELASDAPGADPNLGALVDEVQSLRGEIRRSVREQRSAGHEVITPAELQRWSEKFDISPEDVKYIYIFTENIRNKRGISMEKILHLYKGYPGPPVNFIDYMNGTMHSP